MRGNINYQVNQLWSKVDGINISKATTRKDSNIKAQNGHKVSDKVHITEYLNSVSRNT